MQQRPGTEHRPGSPLMGYLAPTPAVPPPTLPPLSGGLQESPDQARQDNTYLSKRVIPRGQNMTRQPNHNFPFQQHQSQHHVPWVMLSSLPPSAFLFLCARIQKKKEKKKGARKEKRKAQGAWPHGALRIQARASFREEKTSKICSSSSQG